jgi:aromatic-L-amino-acid decarboxylase
MPSEPDPAASPPGHMSPDEFRRAGHRLVDWIADYLANLERFPVQSRVAPGEVRAALPAVAPERPEPFGRWLEDVERIVVPGLTHWQHPGFFAYFPANASGPAILGDLLSSGLGVQGMLWSTSPACTEVETHVLDWLVPALGLPEAFLSGSTGGGVIQDTASSAIVCAIVAARDRATGGVASRDGLQACPRRLVAYASTQTHSLVSKGLRIAGLGEANLRLIEVDDRFAMRADLLERAIRDDLAAGHLPFFCCATVGTTSSLAVDPVPAIGRTCREHGLWMHVDAAFAGVAPICPEFRHLHDGVELADSYGFNPHKWMLVNFDCHCFWVADRSRLVASLSVLPEYLRNAATESGKVIDYRDWHVPLGRRFRSLKLWWVLRHYGLEGIRAYVRGHVRLAERFEAKVRGDDRFELVAPRTLSLVCFRRKGSDAANERLLERLNREGRAFLSHTRLAGKFTIRLAIGAPGVEERHVDATWAAIANIADGLASD